jgi:hypothetical protein
MKASYVLSFLCGAAVMLGFSTLSGSNSPHHVYELRLYHVNEGKMDALKARFGNQTDAIFKRHNMKSIGSCSSTFWNIPAVREGRRIGPLSKPTRNGRR